MTTMSEAAETIDTVRVELVLTRGPTTLPRRLTLWLPCDGRAVSLGRAPHCAVILDPLLVFASQVQCSLFALPVTHTHYNNNGYDDDDEEEASVKDNEAQEESEETVMTAAQLPRDTTPTEQEGLTRTEGKAGKHTPASPSPMPQVYITDMGSSNGTFVNDRRISSIEPTALHEGDRCIFGGMRDIEVGAQLPADAFAGPELIVWQVILLYPASHTATNNNNSEKKEEEEEEEVIEARRRSIAFEATPMVLPKEDVWRAETCALLASAQRSLRDGAEASAWAEALAASASTSDRPRSHRDVHTLPTPQQLFPPQDATACAETTPRPAREQVEGTAQEVHVSTHEQTLTTTHELASTPATTCRATVALSTSALAANVALSAATPLHAPAAQPLTSPPLPPLSPHEQQQAVVKTDDTRTLPEVSAATLLLVPPAPVFYRVMRLGRHRFSVPAAQLWSAPRPVCNHTTRQPEEEEEAQEVNSTAQGRSRRRVPASRSHKRSRAVAAEAEAERRSDAGSATRTPYALSFTSTHWRWAMNDPNTATASQEQQQQQQQQTSPANVSSSSLSSYAQAMPFHCLLPITSVATVLACAARLGLAVELKEGCQLPLVQPRVTSGRPEYRWLVWRLEATQPLRASATTPLQPRNGNEPHTEAKGKAATTTTAAQKVHEGTSGDDDGGVAADKAAVCETAQEKGEEGDEVSEEGGVWFTQWLGQLEAFYAPYGFPLPHLIDANTFDQLFAQRAEEGGEEGSGNNEVAEE